MAYRNARDRAVASADFGKLGQLVLKQRFIRACAFELAYAYIVAVVANLNLKRGLLCIPLALFSLKTFTYTIIAYIGGLVVLGAHAKLYQVIRAPYNGSFPKLQRLLRSPKNTCIGLSVYTLLSCLFLTVHGIVSGGRATQMWVYPEGYYGAPQLNPSWLASWAFALTIGFSYSIKLFGEERLQLSFPSLEQSRIYIFKDRLPKCFSSSLSFTLSVLMRFWIVYFIFGWGIYQTTCAVLAYIMHTSSYSIGNPLFSINVLMFWLFEGFLTVLGWELAHQLFEMIATEPTHINELSLDRNACLVNGLKLHSHPLIQSFAYQELYRIAAFNTEQRKDIFSDIDRSSGDVWSQISRECISVIKAATAQLAIQDDTSKSAGEATDEAKMLDTRGASIDTTAFPTAGGAPIRDILRAKSTQPAASFAKHPSVSENKPAIDIFGPETQGLEKYVLTALRDALLRSSIGQKLISKTLKARSTASFVNFQQQVWAVRSLTLLIEHSLTEDKYGIVQADLPEVMGILVGYLSELEKHVANWNDVGISGSKRYTIQTTSHQASAMIQVVRTSLYAFVITFYDYLDALKLPPSLGKQLQRFADFQA